VVVEAVIRHDGEVLDCQIAESSGHGVLDQDALAVLRRASPLPLKHPLGRDQVTILLPITYRLHS
jgi:protein TonB